MKRIKITSSIEDKVTKAELKYYSSLNQKKYRDIEDKFPIEGDHLIEEILQSKYYKNKLEKIFISKEYNNEDILTSLKNSNIPLERLDKKDIEKLSDTKTPQGIVGVVNKNHETKPDAASLIVALDEINDPGNLGTIIRTCYWFNVDELILSAGTADIFNPKVIRSSQGAIFNLAIRTGVDLGEYLDNSSNNGWKVYLTLLNSTQSVSETQFSKEGKYIFVFGNESNGISKNIASNSSLRSVKIPSYSGCKSLNVGISVGIVLNEFRNKVN